MKTSNPKLKKIKTVVLSLGFVLLSQLTFAQPDNEDPEPVPIDGGVSILVAAGVAYGVKKVRDHRKKEKEESL